MAKAAKKAKAQPPRKDGRSAALYYMRPEYIAAVRDKAAANDQKAWQFVEQAVIKALKDQDAWHFVERAIKALKKKA
ncbi:hypothetical protein [Bradyrhizobium japonicum]|uniref:hypothetical protein n=1 Tax=Bradyrhizobium japonicum TaxID=375 RepID=UPI002715233C|nr:hypothetical protein [Bradyrhizobium japonicum]WLB23966.1 hypothetical protein QIH95_49290 [Bradyrhizobium japonicum]